MGKEQIKKALLGSLAPWTLALASHFVNNDYVTVEITYSTGMHVMRYLLGHGRLVQYASMSFTMKPWLLLYCGYAGATSWLCYMRLCSGSCHGGSISRREAVLQLPRQPGGPECVRSSCSPSCPPSLLAHALPTLGSMNSEHSVNSKTLTLLKLLPLLQT